MISNQEWDDILSERGTFEGELERIKSGLKVIRTYIETKRGDLTFPYDYIGVDLLFEGICCYIDTVDKNGTRFISKHITEPDREITAMKADKYHDS